MIWLRFSSLAKLHPTTTKTKQGYLSAAGAAKESSAKPQQDSVPIHGSKSKQD